MKKYAFLIIAVLSIVIFASGCTIQFGSQTYDDNGITFNYPSSWKELSPSDITFSSGDQAPVIAAVVDPNSIQNNYYETLVFVQQTTGTGSLTNDVASMKTTLAAENSQIISERTLTVSGVPASEIVYTINSSGVAKKERIVLFEIDNDLYAITLSAKTADYNSQQSNFNTIVNSFKVK